MTYYNTTLSFSQKNKIKSKSRLASSLSICRAQMSSIVRKFKQKADRETISKTTFMMRNGKTVLKELITSSNGKYNPYRIFSAQEIKLATNNYDSGKHIKEDSTYKLYKGFWQDRFILVMKFEESSYFDSYGYCINNIVYASQMIHKHILHLIGCCLETEIPTLVFEYEEYTTPADRINGNICFEPLPLKQRLKIAMDIANALAYLHLGFRRPIVFRDFKTSRVLINEENDVKLFDFSLSKSIPEGETHINDAVLGTYGFAAPEYVRTGDFNEKADVYSFGVFIGELLSGQRAVDRDRRNGGDVMILDYMKKYFEEKRFIEVVDPTIIEDNPCPGKEQLLQASAILMFECGNESPIDRPTMVDVAKRLRQMYRSSM